MTGKQALRKDIRKWTKIWLRLKRGDKVIEKRGSQDKATLVWKDQSPVPCFHKHCMLCKLYCIPLNCCDHCPFAKYFGTTCGNKGNPWADFYYNPNTANALAVRDGLADTLKRL